MKSRNLKAIFAAFSAAAILATATTGFAATVNTSTTYNSSTDKVAVSAVVSDVADGEVTYVLKSANGFDGVAYIDAKTAAGNTVTFDYVVPAAKLEEGLTGTAVLTNVAGAVATDALAVDVAPEVFVPAVEGATAKTTKIGADGVSKKLDSATTLIKVVGAPSEYGVIYGGWKFPALSVNGNGYAAVKLVFDTAEVVNAPVKPYYVDANGNEVIGEAVTFVAE